MKKLIIMLAAMLPLFAFVGCSDDEDNGVMIPEEMQYIIGTWVLTDVDTGNTGGYVEWPMEDTKATFNEDGSYSAEGYFGDGSGTYTLEGNTITCFVGGEEYMKYKIIELKENNCELEMYAPGSSDVLKIKCQRY